MDPTMIVSLINICVELNVCFMEVKCGSENVCSDWICSYNNKI